MAAFYIGMLIMWALRTGAPTSVLLLCPVKSVSARAYRLPKVGERACNYVTHTRLYLVLTAKQDGGSVWYTVCSRARVCGGRSHYFRKLFQISYNSGFYLLLLVYPA